MMTLKTNGSSLKGAARGVVHGLQRIIYHLLYSIAISTPRDNWRPDVHVFFGLQDLRVKISRVFGSSQRSLRQPPTLGYFCRNLFFTSPCFPGILIYTKLKMASDASCEFPHLLEPTEGRRFSESHLVCDHRWFCSVSPGYILSPKLFRKLINKSTRRAA